jgi:hypothetical protein
MIAGVHSGISPFSLSERTQDFTLDTPKLDIFANGMVWHLPQ